MTPPRLLLVEDDDELRAILGDVLSEEGYAVSVAASLSEAREQANAHLFDLLLADVVGWTPAAPLAAVVRLREQVQPTPVALMTGWKIGEAEALAQGFACLLHKPFELDDLLAVLAECLQRPLTPAQARAAEVARRYCEAINARDWSACLLLCREDVRYLPSPGSLFDRREEVRGRAALARQLAYNTVAAPDFHYESYRLYARPDGIAARYHATIATSAGRAPLVGSILFQVDGDEITQIGYRLDDAQLRAWTHYHQRVLAQPPGGSSAAPG